MPWRYLIFSVLVLTAAGSASKLIHSRQFENEAGIKKNPQMKIEASAHPISGSSIAPGGVGGRQSQFSAVLGG